MLSLPPCPASTLNDGTSDDAVNFNGDITFAGNASLDVDMQNDDAPVGIDNVMIAASANLTFSGTGSATVKVSKNVLVNSSGSIETVNGNLTVEANQQAIGTTLALGKAWPSTGCLLTTRGTGPLTVKGTGGTNAQSNNNDGVLIAGNGSKIFSTGGARSP